MCCFSRAVLLVADTNIFARPGKSGRQFLVYGMTINSADPVAMILPIPTPKASKEDAVKFLSLEKYPEFFTEMNSGFPLPPPPRGPAQLGGLGGLPKGKLEVVEVGNFVASFVPAIRDFARLDEEFRLPTGVWDSLPQYKDWGFAVFQLKKGEQRIHPMAFEFPRANADKLFFPTVHIHDGKVHAKAKFDHYLYCQPANPSDAMTWLESPKLAAGFMTKLDEAHGLVDPKAHIYRKRLAGMLKNEDWYL